MTPPTRQRGPLPRTPGKPQATLRATVKSSPTGPREARRDAVPLDSRAQRSYPNHLARRTPTSWCEKSGRSIKGSDIPHLRDAASDVMVRFLPFADRVRALRIASVPRSAGLIHYGDMVWIPHRIAEVRGCDRTRHSRSLGGARSCRIDTCMQCLVGAAPAKAARLISLLPRARCPVISPTRRAPTLPRCSCRHARGVKHLDASDLGRDAFAAGLRSLTLTSIRPASTRRSPTSPTRAGPTPTDRRRAARALTASSPPASAARC